MPKVTAGPGQTVKETILTEVIESPEKEKLSSDPLEYMDAMSMEKWNNGNHIAYIYRVEPPIYRNATGPAYVTKYATPITLDLIQQEYGGGLWRILVKRGSERVADRNYQVTGTPRDLTRSTQEFSPSSPGGVPPSESGSVVSQAMQMVGNPNAQAATVEMLRTSATAAIEMVKANTPAPLNIKEILELAQSMRGPASTEKPFLETDMGKIVLAAAASLVTALVNRLITPTDPLDQISKYADVFAKLGGGSATSDWKAALVNAAPQIANAVKDTVQEFRLGTEAQMRFNSGRTLPPAPAQQPNPAPPQNVVEMPQQPQGAQPMEPFETKLVELLNDPKITGDQAGEILDKTWPRFVDEIATYSVDQIMMAFGTRPILAPHAGNPRLRQFITEFLEWANDTTPAPPAV